MGFFGGGTPKLTTTLAAKDFGTGFQLLCYAALLIAFGVKLPIVPCTPGSRMPTGKQQRRFTCSSRASC